MKRVVVVGRNGQLARALAECGAGFPDLELGFVARSQIDLRDIDAACSTLRSLPFDLLVNAAAYNDVDSAETDHVAADVINAEAPGQLAALAAERGAAIIHVSTDYVFAGDAAPYHEDDRARPLSRYGASKLEGERRVAAANSRHLVFRTAWLFSPFAGNFVKTMLRLAGERDEIGVVADQYGSPTNAFDLARAMLEAIAALGSTDGRFGIYHAAGREPASRYEFATAVVAASAAIGGPSCRVLSIPSAAYPQAAARPADSRLDCGRLQRAFGIAIPGYRAGLEATVTRILSGAE